MKTIAGRDSSSLSLGVIWSFGTLGYTQPLNEFMISHPDVSITLLTDSSEAIHEKLRKNELNAGITLIHEHTIPSGLNCAVLLDKHVLVIGMKPDHPLTRKKTVTAHDLLPYPLIPMGRSSICYEPLMEELQAPAHSYRFVCECPSFPTACRMTSLDMGLCIVTIPEDKLDETLEGIVFRPLYTRRDYGFRMALLSENQSSPLTRQLADYYRQYNMETKKPSIR